MLPNQRLKRVSHCWRRQLGRGTSQAISHSGFLTAYWIFEEKHISSHSSKVKHAVNKVEQGKGQGSRKAEPTIAKQFSSVHNCHNAIRTQLLLSVALYSCYIFLHLMMPSWQNMPYSRKIGGHEICQFWLKRHILKLGRLKFGELVLQPITLHYDHGSLPSKS